MRINQPEATAAPPALGRRPGGGENPVEIANKIWDTASVFLEKHLQHPVRQAQSQQACMKYHGKLQRAKGTKAVIRKVRPANQQAFGRHASNHLRVWSRRHGKLLEREGRKSEGAAERDLASLQAKVGRCPPL